MPSELPQAGSRTALGGLTVALLWVVATLLCFFLVGPYIGSLLEGNDRGLVSRAPTILPILALLVAIAGTVAWARGLERRSPAPDGGVTLGRRSFLARLAIGTGATVGGVGASVAAILGRNFGWITVTGRNIPVSTPTGADVARSEWQGSRVREYRRLGRTNFDVSDISLGSSRIKGEVGEQVAREAIERGVNYFDTAPDYSEAGSELALGKAMKGHRDRMFVATKFCTPHGNLPAGTSVQHYMTAVEESLGRLQTDRVDLVHIHSCNTVERLMDPNVHEAFDRLKEQGKVRFLGVSTHTPNLVEVANRAVDSGRFDVMMLAYHHGAWPQLGEIVDKAYEADVGIVAMKTLKGAKHHGLLDSRDEADSYTQAAFKWVLQNPHVACLVISFKEPQNVDEYLFASGQRPLPGDEALLHKYDERIAGKHCYQHCGACLGACPEHLAIDDVLRFRMYFEDYGDEKEAMRLYGRLDKKADVCVGCSAPCTGACPFGIEIQTRTSETHQLLTLA